MLPITLIVMMRWGWQSAIFCVGSGILNCALNGGSFTAYLTYCIGNLFVMFMLLPLKKIGKRKIASKWYFSALFVLCSWLCVYLGRSCVWTVCYMITPVEGSAIYSGFVQFAAWDLLSLAMAIAIILVMRRFDGMFEDQMDYLKRLDEEKKQKMMGDAFGDTPIEIDKQTLDILNKDNDLY
jgi:hypothetical protein